MQQQGLRGPPGRCLQGHRGGTASGSSPACHRSTGGCHPQLSLRYSPPPPPPPQQRQQHDEGSQHPTARLPAVGCSSSRAGRCGLGALGLGLRMRAAAGSSCGALGSSGSGCGMLGGVLDDPIVARAPVNPSTELINQGELRGGVTKQKCLKKFSETTINSKKDLII